MLRIAILVPSLGYKSWHSRCMLSFILSNYPSISLSTQNKLKPTRHHEDILFAKSFLNMMYSVLFSLFICSTHVFAAPNKAKSPSISWGNCTDQDPPNLDCGQIVVPIDYLNPNKGQLNLTIARLRASGTKTGSLIYNPGGPGGSGSLAIQAQVQNKAQLFSSSLMEKFDIIGLDLRGTGFSNPVQCDPNIYNEQVSSFPKTEAEFNALVRYNKVFSNSCQNLTGPAFEYMDTASVAKDLELVRQALGEGKLNYLGQSYGTQLGAQYAELYPETVGRFVFDGVTDHSQSSTTTLSTESIGYEATLNKFFQWCNTTQDCALHGQDIEGIFVNLIASADKKPIPAPGCLSTGEAACRSKVTADDILYNVEDGLLGLKESPLFMGWSTLSSAIAEAAAGNATKLSSPLITTPSHNLFSKLGVSCQDWTRSIETFTDFQIKQKMFSALFPHTKGASEFYWSQIYCIGWAAPVINTQHVLNPKQVVKPPKIFLVHSFWDPSTSLVWAVNVRSQLPNSVLALRNGVGHTSYQLYGHTSAAIDKFLLEGILPEDGTTYDD
jgi:pimeloyl-ACP methyl ester carboxylesterase